MREIDTEQKIIISWQRNYVSISSITVAPIASLALIRDCF